MTTAETALRIAGEVGIDPTAMLQIADCMERGRDSHGWGLYGISAKLLKELLSTREKLEQAEQRERWITVSEKLPEIDAEVLAINENDDSGQEIVAIVKRNYLKSPDNADYNDFKERGYTHWRPLPTPPAEHAQEQSR